MLNNLFIILFILLCSCKKNQTQESIYYIENFRHAGMDDYQTIKAACDSLPANSSVYFDPKTYTFSHTIFVEKSINFYGEATLKRENQINYTLKKSANEFSTMLILNNTNGIISSDRFFISLDKPYKRTTAINVVLEVKGDTVILNSPLGKTADNQDGTFPAGTSFFKNINFFWVISPVKYPDQSCSFNKLTFDGNRDNNAGSYAWTLNAGVIAVTKGTTQYRNCTFINSPGESIVGHNADIRNCNFYNLNGSGFHTSADKEVCPEKEIHSYLYDNIFENTNQISSSIGGHSEGAITHSNSGGYYKARGNVFKNIGESVLGALYPSSTVHDWGTSEITFSGNTIDGAGRMVYLIDTSAGTIHNVVIDKNTISNLVGRDWSMELSHWPGIILKSKTGE